MLTIKCATCKRKLWKYEKFGKGEVLQIDGLGNNKKAEIKFESGSTKKLLLQFAKLNIIG